ncbi:hypothetical protein [Priestia megaterium]|uniref:hypothetical protein n=1 Tax=Priestia megaterium TaxID=1404 RepID=UPI0035A860D4
MEKLTKTKYNLKELCIKVLGIKPATFRKNPEKYLNELRKTNHVEIEKGPNSNSPTFYYLIPLSDNEMPAVLLETNERIKLTRNSDKQIELLLKAVLFDDILPIHKELAKVIGKTDRTVGNRVKEMKELGIKLPTPIEAVTEYDKETGEILDEYTRKKCHWYYYDTLPNGNIKKIIDTTEVHRFYGQFFKQKVAYLRTKYGRKYNSKKASGVADDYAKKKLNEEFGFYSINRTEDWNINEDYVRKMYDKYRHQAV